MIWYNLATLTGLHLFVNSAIRLGEHTWAWYLVISLKAASWLISWNPPSPWTNEV